jgi:NAD(P)-dependent dehydrogenase (short-subunit alcohol dehydrogenase family)
MSNTLELFSLKGKKVIVTGASRGLGRAMAEAIADVGADVAVLDIDYGAAEKTAAEIAVKYGVECRAYGVDVSDYGQCQKAVDEAVKVWGGHVDVLLNNAGVCHNQEAEDVSLEDWHRVININMNSAWYMSQIVGRIMIKQRKGSIINLSSMSGVVVNNPQPQASYNVSKAGLMQMTKSLASEWARYNIRVNSIAPGYMDTEICRPNLAPGQPWGEWWLKCTPMGRPGQPAELGPLAVYLASDASSFMTGSIILIDGGYTVW